MAEQVIASQSKLPSGGYVAVADREGVPVGASEDAHLRAELGRELVRPAKERVVRSGSVCVLSRASTVPTCFGVI